MVYEQYEARLRESNALDFDDLLLEAVRLLRPRRAHAPAPESRYEFVMVDEYQDTNRSQYELMRLLTEERRNVAWWATRISPFTAGAAPTSATSSISSATFPARPSSAWSRTTAPPKTFWKPPARVVAQQHRAHRQDGCGPNRGAGEKITLYEAPDAENEALCIADTIENRLRADPRERVAVLYRTNSQSRQIEEALRRYGRKYVVVGGFSFYQRAEVKDAARVSESAGQPAGFRQPAAHHQHAGARHRPHHRRTDRAVRAAA